MSRAGRREEGMVTAETAVVLPTLVALVLLACGLVATCQSALRCEDAARLAARSAARGDDPATAAGLARADAPDRAAVSIARDGGDVHVTVTDAVRLPGPLGGLLPAWTVHGTAVALDESATGEAASDAAEEGPAS